jgi:8-oxo-dGTP diphosphatase
MILTHNEMDTMNTPNQPMPRIGVGVCIIHNSLILMGKRLNAHGNGTWAFPGGHLEFGESLTECARREVLEETGLTITNIRRGPYVEDIFHAENKHYITIIMMADYVSGQPMILEPHKCEQWEWFDWNALPQPLFLTFASLEKAEINLRDYCQTRHADLFQF